jgi:hypothetical protein
MVIKDNRRRLLLAKQGGGGHWESLNNEDIILMPDKWEYPWYAAWDLAFHCVPLAMVDAGFAKNQLLLFLREWYRKQYLMRKGECETMKTHLSGAKHECSTYEVLWHSNMKNTDSFRDRREAG